MLISRMKVVEHLNRFLMPEDKKHIELIIDLSWAGTIALEFGFQCPESKQPEGKEKFIEIAQKINDAKKGVKVSGPLSYDYPIVFKFESKTPTYEDIGVVAQIFHTLVAVEKSISKEKMIEWLQEAWEGGVKQQKVYSMEEEGGILNEYGIVTNFGAFLSMFGKSKGFLPN